MLTAIVGVLGFGAGVVVGWLLYRAAFRLAVKLEHDAQTYRPPRVPPAG